MFVYVCAVIMKSENLNFLEPSGPLQACNGTDLTYILYVYFIYIYIYIYMKYTYSIKSNVLMLCFEVLITPASTYTFACHL